MSVCRVCSLFGASGYFLIALPALSADCGCADPVPADSFSDSGNCIVRQSNNGYCTLDWRHGADTTIFEKELGAQAEAGQSALQSFALSGAVAANTLLSKSETWEGLQKYAETESPKFPLIYKGAATYLDRTKPADYDRDLALSSFVSLIGSALDPKDQSAIALVVNYVNENADSLFPRLTGQEPAEEIRKETDDGVLVDTSSAGCFELWRYPSGDLKAFDFRVVVKTAFSLKGRTCLPK